MFLSTLYSYLLRTINVVLLKTNRKVGWNYTIRRGSLFDYNLCFFYDHPIWLQQLHRMWQNFYPAKYSPKYDIVESSDRARNNCPTLINITTAKVQKEDPQPAFWEEL